MDENQSLKGVLMAIAKDNDLNYENNDSEIIEKIKEKYINENNENKNKKIYKNEKEKEKHKNIYLLKIMTIYVLTFLVTAINLIGIFQLIPLMETLSGLFWYAFKNFLMLDDNNIDEEIQLELKQNYNFYELFWKKSKNKEINLNLLMILRNDFRTIRIYINFRNIFCSKYSFFNINI